ncbi:unnamed protein product [Rhizophagus irregularis]|uniref:Uncharacterized protein n=1 Tax=Rhizophagus irregularis TaxID=588596 RepID=A0A916DYV0_9GLOM|nr:unnamed protein product [Rhizophagus irregularis]
MSETNTPSSTSTSVTSGYDSYTLAHTAICTKIPVHRALEELICITEGKQHQITIGFAQNVLQCESAFQTNKRKRKADVAFDEDYDYLFGILVILQLTHPSLPRKGALKKLRQRNAEFEAELEAEREEKRISAFSLMEEIDKLKKKNADLFAENFDLKREVAKLREELGNRIEELEKNRADNDAENIKRDAENAELKVRVAKSEQISPAKEVEIDESASLQGQVDDAPSDSKGEPPLRGFKMEASEGADSDKIESIQGSTKPISLGNNVSRQHKIVSSLEQVKPVYSATDDSDEIELIKNQNVELDLICDLQSCIIVPPNEQHSSSNESQKNLQIVWRKRNISPRNPFPRKPHVTSKIADAEAVEYDEPGDDDYNVTLLQRVSTGEIRSR